MARHDAESSVTGSTDEISRRVRRLLVLLERQQELYGQLDALSHRQRAIIEQDDADRLLDVLAQRQEIVELITASGVEVEPFRAAWDELMSALPEAEREAVRRRVGALAEMAGRIAARDDEDRRSLESRREGITRELAGLTKGRGAVAAYAAKPMAQGPRFQDREA